MTVYELFVDNSSPKITTRLGDIIQAPDVGRSLKLGVYPATEKAKNLIYIFYHNITIIII